MTRTPPATLYDDDFFAWTRQQAALLRRMPASDEIDLAHVAEEIEGMGKRDLRDVGALLASIFENLLVGVGSPRADDATDGLTEALGAHFSARRTFSPSMRPLVDLAEAWARGRKMAESRLAGAGATMAPMGDACPFALDELICDDFDVRAAAAKVAALSATPAAPPQLDKPAGRA